MLFPSVGGYTSMLNKKGS